MGVRMERLLYLKEQVDKVVASHEKEEAAKILEEILEIISGTRKANIDHKKALCIVMSE